MITRRDFLKYTGIGAAGTLFMPDVLFSSRRYSLMAQPRWSLSSFTETLPIPPMIDARGAGTAVELAMASGTHQFHSDLPAATTWGYGGAGYLGPTIHAMRNAPITLKATNALGAHPLDFAIDTNLHGAVAADAETPRAAVHLHGGNVEPASDGGPEDTFLPGSDYSYNYNNDQEAANIWYHDHALGITRLNVYAGLAGSYWLRDSRDTGEPDNPIGLPTGRWEVPLVVQDKMFDLDGKLAYPLGEFGSIWAPEFFGDVAVVNGKAFPNLDVDRGLYRFRIINGSNSRVYNLRLSTRQPIFVIGGDGGLLNAPVPVTRLTIAPGERVDLLVDFSGHAPGTRITMTNNAATPFPNGPRAATRGGVPLKDIMQFTVGADLGFMGPVPEVLRAAPIIPLTPSRVRNVSLVEIMDSDNEVPVTALLNNLRFHSEQIESPVVDTVEQWNIINTTGDTHPIHMHLVQFQILGRQKFRVEDYLETHYSEIDDAQNVGDGPHPVPSADSFAYARPQPPELHEMGWKDTVRANPGEITRILVPFGANAAPGVPFGNSFTGRYVWHCHILEHEDNEMMLHYEVVDP
jgi:FtsP/CotA-like multicopper oxidase with cupredoxin domain